MNSYCTSVVDLLSHNFLAAVEDQIGEEATRVFLEVIMQESEGKTLSEAHELAVSFRRHAK